MNPENWYDVYLTYREELFSIFPEEEAKYRWSLFKTAFLRYLLSEFGFEREDAKKKMSKRETQAAEEHLKTLWMRSLASIRPAMERALEKLEASPDSRQVYTSVLGSFVDWGTGQVWWPHNRGKNGSFRHELCPPRAKNGDPNVIPGPLMPGKGKNLEYGLKFNELPPELQESINNLMFFLTEPDLEGRVIDSVELESTAEGYKREVLLVLGWFHHHHSPEIPIQELSLDLLFPVFDEDWLDDLEAKERKRFWRKQKEQFQKWLFSYKRFMREEQNSYSPRTWLHKLETLLAVANYQWRLHVESKEDYRKIPLFSILRKELNDNQREIQNWTENNRYVVDFQLKWPDETADRTVIDVLHQDVVEGLRKRCRPRTAIRGRLRSSGALAGSLRLNWMWVEGGLFPCHRQQVSRTEKIALTCLIERPSDVPVDGLYNPLPPDCLLNKRHDGTVKDNYLCRVYSLNGRKYPGGAWIRVIRDYKTWKTHGDQYFVIPNLSYDDGTCLYDYLERFLYGYWLPVSTKDSKLYDWWNPELQGKRGYWITKGRGEARFESFSYQKDGTQSWRWGYVFVMPKTGKPYNDSDFSDAFARGAQKTIRKWVTPHVPRYAWATWGFECELSDAELRSLAYCMGMTLETMRKMYERCRPDKKRQPIDQALDAILFSDERVENVEKIIRQAKRLNKSDRQKVIAALIDSLGA